MITFTSKTASKEELKKSIWEELIKCTMDAVGPIYGDYERTGFDYSECKSGTDKRRKFAISFLEEWTDTNLEVNDDGVVLNDDLHTENTCNDGGYDLKALANAIKNKFPDVIIQGEGMIDYHYSAEEYRIYTEDDAIVYECDGDEGFDECEEDSEEQDNDEETHFSDDLPRMTCGETEVIDALLEYRKQKADSFNFNKELMYALEITEAELVLIYMPINSESIQETQKVGFPLNPEANGVLFLYRSNGDYRTNTDNLVAICSVLNGSDNEWACPNPALLNSLPTFYELCLALNIYLQDKDLFFEYMSMDNYTVLDFQVENGELVSEKIVL